MYTLPENAVLGFGFMFYGVLEQITIKILEQLLISYEPKVLFTIWWSFHLLEHILVFIVKNIYVLYIAKQEFPEFHGHNGKPFPGQTQPKCTPVVAKRGIILCLSS